MLVQKLEGRIPTCYLFTSSIASGRWHDDDNYDVAMDLWEAAEIDHVAASINSLHEGYSEPKQGWSALEYMGQSFTEK